MDASALDYELPPHLIAQEPVEPRDASRLMVVDRRTEDIRHQRFFELPTILEAGDLLVANDSRVIPARLRGSKATGGRVEVLLLRPRRGTGRALAGGGSSRAARGVNPGPGRSATRWEALVRGRVRPGTVIHFGTQRAGAVATVESLLPDGRRLLAFNVAPEALLEEHGELPLPPYIRAAPTEPDRYQTVYARVAGSVAAPTAGLHFTPDLLGRLERAGIDLAFLTLHVGADTFRPIEAQVVEEHPIHSEWCFVPRDTMAAVTQARAGGHRVVAVGTTAARALETVGRDESDLRIGAGRAGDPVQDFETWTDLFISPGHRFRRVDGLITNFHLPRTSLLALVAAFSGEALMRRAYRAAIDEAYRFYSFGDAMLIL